MNSKNSISQTGNSEIYIESNYNTSTCDDYVCLGTSHKSCFNMICLNCDLQVKLFKDYVWKNDVDYIFFRSYYDDIPMLKSKLIPKINFNSYSCQCFWISLNDEKKKIKEGMWCCNGH